MEAAFQNAESCSNLLAYQRQFGGLGNSETHDSNTRIRPQADIDSEYVGQQHLESQEFADGIHSVTVVSLLTYPRSAIRGPNGGAIELLTT